jgi:hypothetical protein
MPSDPELRRTEIELRSEAQRHHDCQKLQKQPTKPPDRRRGENSRSFLLAGAASPIRTPGI